MTKDQFIALTDQFLKIVQTQLNTLPPNRIWLKTIKNTFSAKLYIEGIYNDITSWQHSLPIGRLLDFGAGGGYVAFLLAGLGYQVEAIDIADYKQDRADHRTRADDQRCLWPALEKTSPHLHFQHYEQTIPFTDNTFDGVVAYAVIEHIPDELVDKALKEIRRVVKPDGYLFISRLPRKWAYMEHLAGLFGIAHHERLYGDREIIELMNRHAFDVKKGSITDMVPVNNIFNHMFPLLRIINSILLHTPLQFFAHNNRLICQNTQHFITCAPVSL